MNITFTSTFVYVTALNAISIIFLIISLMKFRGIRKFFALEENKYTLLFGFVGARTYVYLYILGVLSLSTFLWIITV